MQALEGYSSIDIELGNMSPQKSVVIANKNDVDVAAREKMPSQRVARENNKFSDHECTCFDPVVVKPHRTFASLILVILPACIAIIPMIFISIAYLYAQYLGTFKLPPTRNVPYISDIGNDQPQSSFFTIGLVLSSLCTVAVVFVRYVQVMVYIENVNRRVNVVGFLFGVLNAFGMLIVASFQLTGLSHVHYAGAFLYAFSGVIYTQIHTYISHKDKSLTGNYRTSLLILRGVLSAGVLLGFLTFGVFLLPSLVKFNRPGYSVAQAGEWFFAVCKMGFMLTFIADFWKLQPQFSLHKYE